ncbi:MAG TPA: class I SAM-dependent methyltransferase [Desulfobacterales bacterium]|nr:class I SAM-dependent methyltransferase [Desulfobacterales bacterium]
MNLKAHWEQAYANRPPEQLGWYRPRLESSLALIAAVGLRKDQPLIDVGGGASTLVDDLLALGYERITVADLSDAALERARRRLGDRAEAVTWMSADMLTAELPAGHYALWHDRAVFHFLTGAADRAAYFVQLRHALASGGQAVFGVFAPEAPPRCSGLEVRRYTAEALREEVGEGFALTEQRTELHVTPGGVAQQYLYCRFRRERD